MADTLQMLGFVEAANAIRQEVANGLAILNRQDSPLSAVDIQPEPGSDQPSSQVRLDLEEGRYSHRLSEVSDEGLPPPEAGSTGPGQPVFATGSRLCR